MSEGIRVRFLGDFGPFSRMGKSIGYQVTIGSSNFLIDCGAPLFQQIGGHGLKGIKGLILTHCHDDHKRWFTDLSLFNKYAPDVRRRTFLLTAESVHEELVRSSAASLDRSLSPDAKRVVDISQEEFIDYQMLGPRARYRIAKVERGPGDFHLAVVDEAGNAVPPSVAKVVISDRTGRTRMLFRDPDTAAWVEPELFYDFSSDVFYLPEKNGYTDDEGFTIEAVKAPVWHGIPAMGVRIRTADETLVFSTDTNHNRVLWEELYREKRPQRLQMTQEEFEAAPVIRGDINDYIERTWSEQRYHAAVGAFRDAVVIHDISARGSVVHTDYENLDKTVLVRDSVILTHSPDRITSSWVLGDTEKTFLIRGPSFCEVVGDELFRMDADVYHKEAGRYFAGYRNESGSHAVFMNKGLLQITADHPPADAPVLFRVDLYEDIGGRYYPALATDDARYARRADGRVELVRVTPEGSSGRVVTPVRRSPA